MTDLRDRFRSLDDLGAPPDIWRRAENLGSREPAADPGPTAGRKVAVIGLAFVVATAAIGLVIARFQPRDQQPVISPSANLIAFTASEPPPSPSPNENGFIEIAGPEGPPPPTQVYVASPDSSYLRALTDDLAPKGSVAWSPDGSRLAFTAYDLSTQTESLAVITPDGSGKRVVCELCTATFLVPSKGATCVEGCYIGPSPLANVLAWSPDGRWIAARSDGGIAVVDVASGEVKDFPLGGGEVWGVSWSPDASQVAATLDHGGIVVADVTSGQSRMLVGGDPYGGSPPAWSPDGSTIAFARLARVGDEFRAELQMVDARTGVSRTVLGADQLFEVYDLEWSPDGSRLAVLHHPVDPPTAGLLTVNADGSDVRMVALCENDPDTDGLCTSNGGSLAWSPDGTSMLFDNFYGRRHALVTLRFGGRPVPVSGSLTSGCCLAWQPLSDGEIPSATTTLTSSPNYGDSGHQRRRLGQLLRREGRAI
jgi:dipeptidyl aminopeptidase/acylaminoacyl peptidase